MVAAEVHGPSDRGGPGRPRRAGPAAGRTPATSTCSSPTPALPARARLGRMGPGSDRPGAGGQPRQPHRHDPGPATPVPRARIRGTSCMCRRCQAGSASVGASLYSATKFGLRGFAGGLRADLHGTGVGVSVVFPGFRPPRRHVRGRRRHAAPGRRHRHARRPWPHATIKAIRHNRAEVVVAPVTLRVGAFRSAP